MSSRLTDAERQALADLARGERHTQDVLRNGVGPDPEDGGVSGEGTVSRAECRHMREQFETHGNYREIADAMGRARDTVYTHAVTRDCTHSDRKPRLSERKCGVIREMAHDGKPYEAIADLLTDVSRRQVQKHSTGECSHEPYIEPHHRREAFTEAREG